MEAVLDNGAFYGGSGNEFGFACATDGNETSISQAAQIQCSAPILLLRHRSHQATFPAAIFLHFSGFLVKFNALGTDNGNYYGAGVHQKAFGPANWRNW